MNKEKKPKDKPRVFGMIWGLGRPGAPASSLMPKIEIPSRAISAIEIENKMATLRQGSNEDFLSVVILYEDLFSRIERENINVFDALDVACKELVQLFRDRLHQNVLLQTIQLKVLHPDLRTRELTKLCQYKNFPEKIDTHKGKNHMAMTEGSAVLKRFPMIRFSSEDLISSEDENPATLSTSSSSPAGSPRAPASLS